MECYMFSIIVLFCHGCMVLHGALWTSKLQAEVHNSSPIESSLEKRRTISRPIYHHLNKTFPSPHFPGIGRQVFFTRKMSRSNTKETEMMRITVTSSSLNEISTGSRVSQKIGCGEGGMRSSTRPHPFLYRRLLDRYVKTT